MSYAQLRQTMGKPIAQARAEVDTLVDRARSLAAQAPEGWEIKGRPSVVSPTRARATGRAPIEREQPFTRLKPGVEQLVAAQLRQINHLVKDAADILDVPVERPVVPM